MWIFFTNHIIERLIQRWILKKSIEYIIENWEYKDENWRRTYEWTYNNKKIRLITQINWKHLILITAYYIW